jgi:hypothetical protein
MTSLRARLEPVAIALVLATLLFGRQIASWSTVRNRYHYHWQSSDGLALVTAILLLALVLYAVGMALARTDWAGRRRLHELALGTGLLAALLSQVNKLAQNTSPVWALGLWVVAGGVLGLAWWRWAPRVAAFSRGACLLMSPLVPILFVQILLWRPWDIREHATTAGPPPGQGHTPVVVVVFDEWSWFRAAPAGEPAAEFVNLRRLARQSVLLTEARSPSYSTRISMPRLIYEESGDVVIGNGVAWWVVDSVRRPAPEVPEIFDRARRQGYRTQLLGYYLPYRALLGPDAPDRILTFSHAPKGRSWPGEVVEREMGNLQYWTDPLSKAIWRRYFNPHYSENWHDVTLTLRSATLDALKDPADNSLIVSHLTVPHYPFIWNADGSYRGPFEGDRRSDDTAGYHRNMLFADRMLGEILDTLESVGRLERTLLVVTSDHAWRKEPDSTLLARPDAPRRVPLLIKWPGQKRPMVREERFCTMGLGPILHAAMAPAAMGPPELTDSLWDALSAKGRRESCEE